MALPQDLLAQAKQLATKEPQKPKQASLRRSVSTAYYALFHLLIDAACRFLIAGRTAHRSHLRNQLARAFTHGHMKGASLRYSHAQYPPWLSTAAGAVQPELARVADAFVDLQQARHEADYDLSRAFTKTETMAIMRQVEAAFDDWKAVEGSPQAEAYLVALLLAERK
jgi:uncharacterized protein (UPF0332 family)